MSIGSPSASTSPCFSAAGHEARQHVLAYLGRHHTISLATCGPQGLWAASVFYVTFGFDLYFRSKGSSRHMRNLAVNPRVAGTINPDPEDWSAINGIQLEGWVGPVSRQDENLRVMEAFSLHYPFVERLWGDEGDIPGGAGETSQRMAFHVRPERIVFYDHDHGQQKTWELAGSDLDMG